MPDVPGTAPGGAPATDARDARRRVLDLLEAGRIGAEIATDMLRVVSDNVDAAGAKERTRILGLVEGDVLAPEQALTLLRTLAPSSKTSARDAGARAVMGGSASAAAHVAATRTAEDVGGAARRGGIAQTLKITIDAKNRGDTGKNAKIRVNVPLSLARFAARFMPADAQQQLNAQGIDLGEILQQLGDEVPDGPLVDIDADEGDTKARILVEVV